MAIEKQWQNYLIARNWKIFQIDRLVEKNVSILIIISAIKDASIFIVSTIKYLNIGEYGVVVIQLK